MQHTNLILKRRSVADEAKTQDLLHGNDKALMWDRWQKGESLSRSRSCLGAITQRSKAFCLELGAYVRHSELARGVALSLAEREDISRGVVAGHSVRSIADLLARSPSTVSREINRNGGRESYRANEADQAAWDRAHRPKTCKLVHNRQLARICGQ